ncbi:MAG: hypothetical protein AAFN93_21085, partial [Bacteroidota bacterium]
EITLSRNNYVEGKKWILNKAKKRFENILLFNVQEIEISNWKSKNLRCENTDQRASQIKMTEVEADMIEIASIYNGMFELSYIQSQSVSIHDITASEINWNDSVSGMGFYRNGLVSIYQIDGCSISIRDNSFKELRIMSGSPGKLHLRHIDCQKLRLDDLNLNNTEHKEFSFLNTNEENQGQTLTIANSNLSDLNLNSCYFETFEQLEIVSSTLNKLQCTSTTWPKSVVSYPHQSLEVIDYFQVREGCRQLKQAMKDHHDQVSELQFHAREMEAYRQIVRKQDFLKNFNDNITLAAGWTNSFGLNWLKPVLLFLIVTFITYAIILSAHYNISPLSRDFFFFWNWVDYFMLFNPTHRTIQLSIGSKIEGGVAFLDFISRIISAFFLYQIITAFRKFRK